MKKITQKKLNTFLRNHKLWLEDEKCGERADLREADLRWAKLGEADLRGADLYGANLYGAKLGEADLGGAKLGGAKNVSFPIACPEEGEFIGFKKAIGYNSCDSEAWYQCPHCGRRFGSWSVYHNPKNENGVKEYCPYCQKELEGLE